MPTFQLDAITLEIARDSLLVDSNVLVAAFLPGEPQGRKETALSILEASGRPILVPIVVVVESLGFIIGSRKQSTAGMKVLAWVNTPGNATLIPAYRSDVHETYRLMDRLAIDCVDAMLAELATEITASCVLRPAMSIATFDTRDFGRMTKKDGLNLSIYDLQSLDEYEIG